MAEVAGTMSATISAIAEGVATLTLSDGQTLNWPASSLPQGCMVGSSVLLTATLGSRDTERADFAKDLLNEVFHTDDDKQN